MRINHLKTAIFFLLALCVQQISIAAATPWSTVGQVILPNAAYFGHSMVIDSKSGVPYLAYTDYLEHITVEKYEAASQKWVTVGDTVDFTSAHQPDLLISPSGTLYLSYYSGSERIVVMKYDGSQWLKLGETDIRTCLPCFKLAVDQTDVPYLVYEKYYENKMYVSKFDDKNATWVTVGEGAVSQLEPFIDNTSIAITKKGQLYVSFITRDHNFTVMTFDKTWQPVGEKILPEGDIIFNASMTLDNNDNPFVVYKKFDGQFSVLKFSQGEKKWNLVGQANFATGEGFEQNSLSFDSNNTPYLAFPYNGEIYVMKFDGKQWKNYGFPFDKEMLISHVISGTAMSKVYVSYNQFSFGFLSESTINVMSASL